MREPEAWIDLTDFSRGIMHDLGSSVVGGSPTGKAAGPDGAATIENTYRCIALQGGGLGPLPAQDWTYSRPSLGTATGVRVSFLVNGPVGFNQQINVGLASELWDPRSTNTIHGVEFYMNYEYIWNGGTGRAELFTKEEVYNTGPTMTAPNVISIESNSVSTGAHATTLFTPGQAIIHWLTHTSTTTPVVVRNYQALDGTMGIGTIATPDPNTRTGSVAFGSPFNTGTMGPTVSHQGRILQFNETAGFVGTGLKSPNDFYYFTVPTIPGVNANSYVQDTTGGTAASVVTQDSLSGIGIAASISASDLLIITHTKGGVLVQGDLANPTVRRMPGVQSTYGAQMTGVQTPLGFVYGVNYGGVYAWTGDSSTALSAHLPDDFWVVPNTGIINNFGRFELWNNWVMCPNNWLLDCASGSWWRLDDPSVFAAYEWMVNPYNGYVYGNAPVWTDPGSGTVSGYLRGYNRRVGATTFSWQSQPLVRTRNRVVDVREVTVNAQGVGNIQVVISARSGSNFNSQTQTFTLSGVSTLYQYLRQSYAVQGQDVIVQIISTGTGGNPAPTVYSVHIGYNERMHLGAG